LPNGEDNLTLPLLAWHAWAKNSIM
jgi:hypothetical protein